MIIKEEQKTWIEKYLKGEYTFRELRIRLLHYRDQNNSLEISNMVEDFLYSWSEIRIEHDFH